MWKDCLSKNLLNKNSIAVRETSIIFIYITKDNFNDYDS